VLDVSPHTGKPKQATRRLTKPSDKLEYNDNHEITAIIRSNRKWLEVGKDYAVQAQRGKPAIGRTRIKSIKLERVKDISLHDANLEGVATIDDFFKLWLDIHPTLDVEVYAIEFELVENMAEKLLKFGSHVEYIKGHQGVINKHISVTVGEIGIVTRADNRSIVVTWGGNGELYYNPKRFFNYIKLAQKG